MLEANWISGPNNGLAEKIGFIKSQYAASLTDPRLRRFAENAVGRGTRLTQARNLWDRLRGVFIYVPDPVGAEYTKTPSRMIGEYEMLGNIKGDCDDQACMAYTLLRTLGIPAGLRVTWHGKPLPQHIYALALVDGLAYAFDTTRARGFGEDPPFSRKEDF